VGGEGSLGFRSGVLSERSENFNFELKTSGDPATSSYSLAGNITHKHPHGSQRLDFEKKKTSKIMKTNLFSSVRLRFSSAAKVSFPSPSPAIASKTSCAASTSRADEGDGRGKKK
jgi:hypothetical protein